MTKSSRQGDVGLGCEATADVRGDIILAGDGDDFCFMSAAESDAAFR